jgi:hypothetical protein
MTMHTLRRTARVNSRRAPYLVDGIERFVRCAVGEIVVAAACHLACVVEKIYTCPGQLSALAFLIEA